MGTLAPYRSRKWERGYKLSSWARIFWSSFSTRNFHQKTFQVINDECDHAEKAVQKCLSLVKWTCVSLSLWLSELVSLSLSLVKWTCVSLWLSELVATHKKLLSLSSHGIWIRVGKISGIIFSGSKYLGYLPRYLLEVNTFVQGVLGTMPMPEYLPR